jgi:hypothetical protein
MIKVVIKDTPQARRIEQAVRSDIIHIKQYEADYSLVDYHMLSDIFYIFSGLTGL